MRAKLGQLNSGPYPEMLAIGCEMAMYHIEAGARKFADYTRAMISDLGDAVRPYLKSFYNGARDLPGMEDLAQEMDSYADVSAADVNNMTEPAASDTADETQTAEEERVVSFQQEYLNAQESGNTVPETIESVPEEPVYVPESTESVPEGKTDTKAELEQRPHHSGFAADESISERKKHFSISSLRNNVGAPYWSVKSNLAGFDRRADEEYNKLGHEKYRPLGTKNWDPNEFIFFDEDEAYRFIYNVWGVKREEMPAINNSLTSESAATVGSITKDVHTKTGADLWVVKSADRVSSDEFAELKRRAKSYGGYYSKFKKGFIFDTEDEANRFNNLN